EGVTFHFTGKSYSTGRSIARKPLQSNHPSLFPALTRYPSRSRVLGLLGKRYGWVPGGRCQKTKSCI
ncbi:MAG: hypothetical protein NTW21_20770, partial [Verrucomicrobia bacterium]|nr:hypothetical protein [Verrucomicrobiota bacterium]